MIQSIKKLLLPISILIILGFVLFLINQISGVYLLVQATSEVGAQILLGVLSVLFIALIAWPIVLYLKLPRPLKLPTNQSELSLYQKKLLKRLKTNSILISQQKQPASEQDLSSCLEILDQSAAKLVHQTATTVFLTTAVSQNGKLDALTILVTQSRMVWKIAHVYYQRPTLRELIYLYANVAGASFLASELEDLDISQQIEPVISSFIRSSAGKSIPVIGPTAHIVLDSLLEGSTNAFLTLRVGHITKKYCGNNQITSISKLRKEAFVGATKELKAIIVESSGKIIGGLAKATRKASVDTLKSGWEGMKNTGTKIAENVSKASQKINPFSKQQIES